MTLRGASQMTNLSCRRGGNDQSEHFFLIHRRKAGRTEIQLCFRILYSNSGSLPKRIFFKSWRRAGVSIELENTCRWLVTNLRPNLCACVPIRHISGCTVALIRAPATRNYRNNLTDRKISIYLFRFRSVTVQHIWSRHRKNPTS